MPKEILSCREGVESRSGSYHGITSDSSHLDIDFSFPSDYENKDVNKLAPVLGKFSRCHFREQDTFSIPAVAPHSLVSASDFKASIQSISRFD